MAAPGLTLHTDADPPQARVQGTWTLAQLGPQLKRLRGLLAGVPADAVWDLRAIEALDSTGALLLWRAWGGRQPALEATASQRELLERVAALPSAPAALPRARLIDPVASLGRHALRFPVHVRDFVALLGQLSLDALHLLRHPVDAPLRETSANVFKAGVTAMPVTALVGFLIGVVLSYLSALQLRLYGADTLIVDILGIGIPRELGPVLVAVLIAGRSGSAMTAQLGTMRVTEEIDALAVMGVSRTVRLVWPKVVGLALAMPLLVLWTSLVALFGGAVAAQVQLDMSPAFFFAQLPRVVPLPNVFIGLAKGFVFGVVVALVACHFGLRVKPNTESLSSHTTSSVVTAITLVILIDAVFAIATRNIGVGQ
jgi:phospholipid/cholesterol/gamma-HCH transport system permease protein